MSTQPTAENGADTDERVQVFAEGLHALGTLRWGWQCFTCREEETGFGTATAAAEGRDSHAALCVIPPTEARS